MDQLNTFKEHLRDKSLIRPSEASLKDPVVGPNSCLGVIRLAHYRDRGQSVSHGVLTVPHMVMTFHN